MQTLESFPLITVLMPVYNGERFVLDAVASILAQTFEDFELLVIDDGSTDKTRNLLETISDPRVHVLANPTNLGLIATLNRGLELARGRYLARMDADDLAAPERLARQIDYLERHPHVHVLGCMAELIDEHGRRCSSLAGYPTEPAAIRDFLFQECCLIHPSVVFRTDTVREAGGYSASARHAEDYELWLRLSDNHALANLPDKLISYRIHPGQVSITNLMIQYATVQTCRNTALARRQARGEDMRAVEKIIHPSRLRRWSAAACTLGRDYLNWYTLYRLMQQPKMAFGFALSAVKHSPLSPEAWKSLFLGAFEVVIPKQWRRIMCWYFTRVMQLFRRKAPNT
jgi:glycosyltransferase involved in cell wall biosynthesis